MTIPRYICLTATLVLIIGCGTDYRPPDPMALVRTEHDFAAAVAAKGMRDGFLEYLADDGVLFVPGVVNGREHYEASPQRSSVLTWVPTYAEIASAGDLGFATGPWDWRQDSTVKEPTLFGHYVTIWKRQPDSTWKFVLDIGVAHEAHQSSPPPPELNALERPAEADELNLDQVRRELVEVEHAFSSASASEGLVAAYLPRITDDIHFLRMGEYPVRGVGAATDALSRVDGIWIWEPNHVDVARNGDLGYTYGVSELAQDGGIAQFSYVHIWRRDLAGLWRLALDIHIPLPSPQEETPRPEKN